MARKWKLKEEWAAVPADQRVDEIFTDSAWLPGRTRKVRDGLKSLLQSQDYLAAKAASAPWKPFLRPVPVRADGMPENPTLRSAVVELSMEKFNERLKLEHVIDHLQATMDKGKRRTRLLKKFIAPFSAEEVLKSVVDSGRFKFNGEHFDFSPRKRRDNSEEAKLENYEAAIRNIADRACDTDGGKTLAGYLFRTWRNLYSPIAVDTSRGRGMLIPTRNGVDSRTGAFVAEALLVIAESHGVECYLAPEGSLVTRWKGYDPVVDVDVERLIPDGIGLAETRVSPAAPWELSLQRFNTAIGRAFSVSKLTPYREAASAYVEEEISPAKWRGFAMSLCRKRSLGRAVRQVLVSVLEPDVRRAALRDPFAKFSLYNWFAAGEPDKRLRRIQASEAFPVATFLLPELEEVIDAGKPLVAALMERTGMSKSSVKALGGLHWQKIGARNCRAVLSMGGVPKERIPSSKGAWACAAGIVGAEAGGRPWLDHLPVDMRHRFMKAASSDWQAYETLFSGDDFLHAMTDTAGSLMPLPTGRITTRKVFDPAMFALLVELVGGEAFGVKRLRKFGETWHAGVQRRVSIERTILKKAFGELLSTWTPLTENFENEFGTMRWLVTEDELAAEGQEMRHCVGSYVSRCVEGTSHIATFHGRDGTRSTAEFVLRNGAMSLVQHRTHRNKVPAGDVVRVFDAFQAANAKRKFKIVRGTSGGEDVAEGLIAEASEETLESIRRTFADLVPEHCLSWSGERWRKEMARFAQEGAELVPLERNLYYDDGYPNDQGFDFPDDDEEQALAQEGEFAWLEPNWEIEPVSDTPARAMR